MASHDLTLSLLVGNGVAAADSTEGVRKAKVDIAPAYEFQRNDGKTNWPVVVSRTTDTGELLIENLEDTDGNGDPVVWQMRVSFLDRGNGVRGGGEAVTFTIPTSKPNSIDYPADVTLVDAVQPPEYGPTWAAQAEAAKNTAVAAAAAATAVGSTNDTIIAGRINTAGSATDLALTATTVRQGETYHYAKGLAANGSTDDTAKILAEVAALPTHNVFGNVTDVLVLPAGRIIFNGSATFANRTIVRGAGKYLTLLYSTNAVTGDAFTFNGTNSGIEHLTIGGNGAAKRVGAGVVWNAQYPWALNTRVENIAGDGYVVGDGSGAIGAKFYGADARDVDGIGINVKHVNSTDGQFTSCDLGRCGSTGFKASAAGTQLTMVHAWGCGIVSGGTGGPASGIHLAAAGCMAHNCVSETNYACGIFVGTAAAVGCHITGGSIWGNGNAGVAFVTTKFGNITGAVIYNNGQKNTGFSSSDAFAGIQLDAATDTCISGNTIFDNAAALVAGTYPNGTPAFPYTGRTAQSMQSIAIGERNAANRNTITGNQARSQDTRAGIGMTQVGADDTFAGNDFGAGNAPTVASAATITIPGWADVVEITGTTAISSINTGRIGRRVTLIFTNASPGTVTSGSHLVLRGGGTFTPFQNWTLTLISQGTTWYEISRTA